MNTNRKYQEKESNIYQFRNTGNSELDTNNANIGHSGNSDVDVYVNIEMDTNPIAYAMLCSLLATKQISNSEFDMAVEKLDQLTKNRNNKKEVNIHSNHDSTNNPGQPMFGSRRNGMPRKRREFGV